MQIPSVMKRHTKYKHEYSAQRFKVLLKIMCLQTSTVYHMVTSYLHRAVVDSHFQNPRLHHLKSLLLQEVVGTCEDSQFDQEVPHQCCHLSACAGVGFWFLLEVFPQSFCNNCETVPLERGFCTR